MFYAMINRMRTIPWNDIIVLVNNHIICCSIIKLKENFERTKAWALKGQGTNSSQIKSFELSFLSHPFILLLHVPYYFVSRKMQHISEQYN
jgi:hypothetical protein